MYIELLIFAAIQYVRGGDILFVSLHSFCPHLHTEHWMPAKLNRNITMWYPHHHTSHTWTPAHSPPPHTSTLTPSHPHPHASPLSTSPPFPFPSSHTHTLPFPFSHPPISLFTPHTSEYTHYYIHYANII